MAIQSQSFTDYLNARRAEVQNQFAQAQRQQTPQPAQPQQVTQMAQQPQQPQQPQQSDTVTPRPGGPNLMGPFAPMTPQIREELINEQFVNQQQDQMQQFLADQQRYFANQRNTDAQWNQVNQLYQPWTAPQVQSSQQPQPQQSIPDGRMQIPQQPQGPTAQQSVANAVAQAMAEREQQQAMGARFRDNNHAGVRFLREALRYNQP